MTRSTDRALRVAAIGDLHVRETHERPYRELFLQMCEAADVMVLCGDLTNYGKPGEVEILADDLRGVGAPVFAVLGNHDHESGQPEFVRRRLTDVGVRMLDDGEAYEIQGVGFAGCMGAMGGYGRGMLSAFGEAAVKAFVQESMSETMKLENGLRMVRAPRALAVLHYSPIADTLAGEPLEIYPFLGNGRLAETVDRFENVRAVVHGHAHHGVHVGRTPKGVPVYNCAQTVVMAACGRPFALIDL